MLTNKQTNKTIMAYNQKNSPFKQTKGGSFDFSKSAHEAKYGSDSQPKTEQVTIGKRAKRGLKDAYDIALTKGYRKKSESFADYSKRAKADPLYGKSGSKGYTVKATDGMVDVAPYKDKISVEDLKKKEAKEYAAKTKKLNAGASKIRKGRKLNEQAKVQKTDTKKKETKVQNTATPSATKAPKKTTKVTVSRRDQRRLDKQAKREARIAETRKKGKAAAASGDKIAANRLRRKQARIEARIAKTNKKMSESAGIKTKKGTYNFAEGTGPKTSKFDKTKNAGDKPKTKVKARRRAAKGSTRATLRK